MARSRWKLIYFEKSIWRKIKKITRKKYIDTKPIIFSRKSSVPDIFSPFPFNISKGKISSKLTVTEFNVGYKFGEFSFTRKPFYFPMKRSNQKNNINKRR